MVATLAPMSRPKKPPTENTRLDSEILKKVRIIAADRGISVPDCLVELLREPVEQELRRVIQGYSKRKQAE